MEKVRRLRPECLSCLAKKYLDKYPEDASVEIKTEYMRRALQILACAEEHEAAPVVVNRIAKVHDELFGATDEFRTAKKHFNQVMLGRVEAIQAKLDAADDPLLLGLQYAMVGNYIDFGAMKQVDEAHLSHLLDNAKEQPIPAAEYEYLKKDLSAAKHLVYLTDNCGEIVLDKLLIQVIQKFYPYLKITAVVKGGNVLNDATMEDAVQVGLTDLVPVTDNGNDIAGTWLDSTKTETRKIIEAADIILSKGQANYETLRFCGLNIYYLFLCKCEMFAKEFDIERFTGMLLNELRRQNS